MRLLATVISLLSLTKRSCLSCLLSNSVWNKRNTAENVLLIANSFSHNFAHAMFYHWSMKSDDIIPWENIKPKLLNIRIFNSFDQTVPGRFRSHALSFPGTKRPYSGRFVPGNESVDVSFSGMKLPSNICSHKLSSPTTVPLLRRRPTRYSMHHYELFN